MSSWRVLVGDCRASLATLPDASVQCCVTSPPYWGLRDYGHEDQIGLERTPEEYVANMVSVFREVWRVLRDDGVLWLNLGDSYAMSTKGAGGEGKQHTNTGAVMADRRWRIPPTLKPKDLVGIPWRVAFALQADGWYLRSDIIWHKPKPMPESVTDRPTKAHEYVFLLTKSERYYYDSEAIAEPLASNPESWGRHSNKDPGAMAVQPRPMFGDQRGNRDGTEFGNGTTRNARSVWTISTTPYPGAHFATFPPELAEKCILAGTSQKGCCAECGAPWERVTDGATHYAELSNEEKRQTGRKTNAVGNGHGGAGRGPKNNLGARIQQTVGWQPTCSHDAAVVPCTVLDPFGGSGTVGMVATGHGRSAIMCELNPEYVPLIRERCGPMLECA